MGRKRTGTKFFDPKVKRWFVVLTVDLKGGGTERRPVMLDDGLTDEQAEAKRVSLAKKAAGRLFDPKEPVERDGSDLTFEQYATDLWLPSRTRRGVRSVRKDRERLKKHVFPILGPRKMLGIAPDNLRTLVEDLDRKRYDDSVEFGWKMADHCWKLTRKLFKDAVGSKEAALRVLKTNPSADVAPPDGGDDKAKQWLYPSEFEQLIQCKDVPLRWRRVYAVAIYLYLRVSEVRALDVADIDLEHGMVTVHRSTDEGGIRVREFTKTASVRVFKFEPALLPLLKAMIGDRKSGKLIGHATKDAAEHLRLHLLAAGVRREALHIGTAVSLPIWFHDLRATGITWAALRGDSTLAIRDRAGHRDIEQTNDYIRRASAVGDVGVPFPSLADLLTDNVSGIVSNSGDGNKAAESGSGEGVVSSLQGSGGAGSDADLKALGALEGHTAAPTDDSTDDSKWTESDFLAAVAESAERGQAAALLRGEQVATGNALVIRRRRRTREAS